MAQNLRDNLGALGIKLDPKDAQDVRRLAQTAGATKSAHYPLRDMDLLFGDTPELCN